MTLYDYTDCPFAKKVRIVLAEKELSYDTVHVDLTQGEQQTEEFRALNPFCRVPVLVDEGFVVYDSTAINEYLNDEYPVPELMPDDSADRARVRMLEDFADAAFTLPAMALAQQLALAAAERSQDQIDAALEAISGTLAMLDRQLKDGEYLVGDYSLADVSFAPIAVELDKLDVKVDPGFKDVVAWVDRLKSRPSVESVLKLVA
ncbi:MAG: glutathione S-transferase family protein [Candidatus Binatia bacterium]